MYTYEHDGKNGNSYGQSGSNMSGQHSNVVQRPRMFKFAKKTKNAENKAIKIAKSTNAEDIEDKEKDFNWPEDLMAIMN